MTVMIELDRLEGHPGNANAMPRGLFEKLVRHIRESGEYPPLIVRRLAQVDGAEDSKSTSQQINRSTARYQILDGHHRAQALRRLGYERARCEVWEVSDERAALLLLTLNRLQGRDDPQRRGALLGELARSVDVEQLSRLVPDEGEQIRRLMALNEAAPRPIAPALPVMDGMPQAVTFFVSEGQRVRLFERLSAVCRDRSEALVRVLGLDG